MLFALPTGEYNRKKRSEHGHTNPLRVLCFLQNLVNLDRHIIILQLDWNPRKLVVLWILEPGKLTTERK